MMTVSKDRRMSLPPMMRQPTTHSHITPTASSHQQRRGSVAVHGSIPQPIVIVELHPPSDDEDDDDDDDTATAAVDAELLSEMYGCRNQIFHMLNAVSQLEVRISFLLPDFGLLSESTDRQCSSV